MNEQLLRMVTDARARAVELRTTQLKVTGGSAGTYDYQGRIDSLIDLAQIFEKEAERT